MPYSEDRRPIKFLCAHKMLKRVAFPSSPGVSTGTKEQTSTVGDNVPQEEFRRNSASIKCFHDLVEFIGPAILT